MMSDRLWHVGISVTESTQNLPCNLPPKFETWSLVTDSLLNGVGIWHVWLIPGEKWSPVDEGKDGAEL